MSNLPAGLSLDSSTGEIIGAPQNTGNFNSILGATNQAGSMSKSVTFEINDFSKCPFRLNIAINGCRDSTAGFCFLSGTKFLDWRF